MILESNQGHMEHTIEQLMQMTGEIPAEPAATSTSRSKPSPARSINSNNNNNNSTNVNANNSPPNSQPR